MYFVLGQLTIYRLRASSSFLRFSVSSLLLFCFPSGMGFAVHRSNELTIDYKEVKMARYVIRKQGKIFWSDEIGWHRIEV
jgi:hypothetical protein